MASLYKRKIDGKKSKKWYVSWYDADNDRWRDSVAYTDKRASAELGERLEKESAMKAEGLIDPLDEHRRRPVAELLAEFISTLKSTGRSSRYVLQVENRIQRIIDGTSIKHLHELDPVRVNEFLSSLRTEKKKRLSGHTTNEYIRCLREFTKWAVLARRLGLDPLASLKRVERKAIKPTHPRRGLSWTELGKLLDAAERRPLLEVQTIRTGPNKGMPTAKVSDRVKANKIHKGRERRLVYLLAIWTGLRRNEIRQLRWADVDLDCLPRRIRLRAETTKSKRADSVVIHPQLAEALRQFKPTACSPDDQVVSTVPDMKAFKADLKLAGIEYGDQAMGYADLHATRMSLSTKMAAEGLSLRVRQAQMRHTDPRLTDNTYMDENLLPIADEIMRLPSIPVGDAGKRTPDKPIASGHGRGNDGSNAGNMQETLLTARRDGSCHGLTDTGEKVAKQLQGGVA